MLLMGLVDNMEHCSDSERSGDDGGDSHVLALVYVLLPTFMLLELLSLSFRLEHDHSSEHSEGHGEHRCGEPLSDERASETQESAGGLQKLHVYQWRGFVAWR
jgi:hypothetical protein